jgi:23S rRNA (uracil1939-C5)-methyltransferase
MKQNLGNEIILNIENVDSKARGIARVDGYVVFVPGALIGETVTAHIVERKKHYSVAKIKSLLKASPYRVQPRCEVYEACGGCNMQHASYDHQVKVKSSLIEDAIIRIGKWKEADIAPVIPSFLVWGYRNKAIIQARYQKGERKLGYFARGTHDVVNLKACPILDPLIYLVYANLRNAVLQSDLSFYDEETGEGLIRNFVLRSSFSMKKILLAWIFSREPDDRECKMISDISNGLYEDVSPFLGGVQININPSKGNFIWGSKTQSLFGKDVLVERFENIKFRFGVSDFFQVNVLQAFRMFETVAELARDSKHVLELYSGVGSMTAFLASFCNDIVAVEEWRPAYESLVSNMTNNGINNVTAICGKAEDVVKTKVSGHFDIVVVDPPRTGCHKDVLNFIGRVISPKKVIYVSCNPATLARDSNILNEYGYNMGKAMPLDMFPQTSHVECVTLMSKP